LLKEATSIITEWLERPQTALALEHGAELASSDRDFSRFPGLKLINPLRG
jgi:hypothetical protein